MRQTEHSCEATPGCPSGHTMFNAALLYVVLDELLQNQKHRSAEAYRCLKIIGWSVITIHLILVSTSRMYFGCHFLHQCVLGVALGLACSKFILSEGGIVGWLLSANKSKFGLITTGLVFIGLSIFFAHILVGSDPLWSIRMVSKIKQI